MLRVVSGSEAGVEAVVDAGVAPDMEAAVECVVEPRMQAGIEAFVNGSAWVVTSRRQSRETAASAIFWASTSSPGDAASRSATSIQSQSGRLKRLVGCRNRPVASPACRPYQDPTSRQDARHYGTSRSFPTVFCDSRSAWADAASSNG